MRALEQAEIKPHDKVLEVAVGPAVTYLEILKRVDKRIIVYGVDLSPKMLNKTRKLARAAGYTNIDLREADARKLPFPAHTFDLLYNSFMFDLLSLRDMPLVLGEFMRVLKPGGRLVLVSLSKEDWSRRTWYEKLYTAMPRRWVPYVLGGCRPVLMEPLVKEAGFTEIRREFVQKIIPSEIVLARRPSAA
jgi:demethylmenaquinone methyltransferase/2-methoxy-6-polyprenyl-1,4-benzoquinol methylase